MIQKKKLSLLTDSFIVYGYVWRNTTVQTLDKPTKIYNVTNGASFINNKAGYFCLQEDPKSQNLFKILECVPAPTTTTS